MLSAESTVLDQSIYVLIIIKIIILLQQALYFVFQMMLQTIACSERKKKLAFHRTIGNHKDMKKGKIVTKKGSCSSKSCF